MKICLIVPNAILLNPLADFDTQDIKFSLLNFTTESSMRSSHLNIANHIVHRVGKKEIIHAIISFLPDFNYQYAMGSANKLVIVTIPLWLQDNSDAHSYSNNLTQHSFLNPMLLTDTFPVYFEVSVALRESNYHCLGVLWESDM